MPLKVPAELPRNHDLLTAIPAPRELSAILRGDTEGNLLKGCHPGLRLDKYLIPARSQEDQKARLSEIAGLGSGDVRYFEDLGRRRQAMLDDLGAMQWPRTTASTLTLHLARAAILENAGLCLHPIHGFAYLPGTELKGLARAFAETIWGPAQPDPGPAKVAIERVFGHAAQGTAAANGDAGSRSGNIVFHDAWPRTWPRLIVDIVNNHHVDYYQGKDAPGDWEAPTMVYFLAVPAGQEFDFALGKRRDDTDDHHLALAREWLEGGLVHLGCGAKTASGYGRFQLPEGRPAELRVRHVAEASARLTLVAPAFLAGADQTSEQDCDLRPATLRGLLRWWWRTLHSGYVNVSTLRALEAALWGDTSSSGAVLLSIERGQAGKPLRYVYKDRFEPQQAFKRRHGLADRPDNRTTQGLFYASYGMDDRGNAGSRFHLDPGASWTVRIVARSSRYFSRREDARDPAKRRTCTEIISVQQALNQARAALWLLCHFGAVGSKAGKGFGSLDLALGDADINLARCEADAAELRRHLGLAGPFRGEWAESPALGNRLDAIEVPTAWTDSWYALDQVGFAYQAFTQAHKHEATKLALGLPRRIHGPRNEPFPGQRNHRRPVSLRAPGGEQRHASPVHIHLGLGNDNRLIVRVLAFPAPRLPHLEESVRFLRLFLGHLSRELEHRGKVAPRLPKPSPPPPTPHAVRPTLPKTNTRVPVKLLEQKTKKGGWMALHEPSGLSGPVQDPKNILRDKQPGEIVTLAVAYIAADGRTIQFKAE